MTLIVSGLVVLIPGSSSSPVRAAERHRVDPAVIISPEVAFVYARSGERVLASAPGAQVAAGGEADSREASIHPRPRASVARTPPRWSGETGFVKWASKPAASERCRSSA